MRVKATRLITTAVAVMVAGCGPAASTAPSYAAPSSLPTASPAPGSATARPSQPPDPLASASAAGRFAVDATGRNLVMSCWGTGAPAVFLESGGGGIDEMSGSNLVHDLAEETQVCLYNRAGLAPSDPAPNVKREAEDVAADFRALVEAAGLTPPFVLFGRSFGGMIVTFYASTHPDDVVGVVVFDSPAPSATMTIADCPECVWDNPGSLEHLDVLYGFENRFGKTPVHIDAPLILISTTAGESQPDDRYWLQVSDTSSQVVLTGGMEIINQQAAALAEQILSLVRAARS
jgi:pimeloyl-ACP methyl ester carboxylesterase